MEVCPQLIFQLVFAFLKWELGPHIPPGAAHRLHSRLIRTQEK